MVWTFGLAYNLTLGSRFRKFSYIMTFQWCTSVENP